MTKDADFYTLTMAKVYAEQGYFGKAVEICRYLLEKEPGRQDLIETLTKVENLFAEKEKKDSKGLVQLFSKWIDLSLRLNAVQKLKKLRSQL